VVLVESQNFYRSEVEFFATLKMVSFTALCALFYHLSATLASPRNSIPRSSGLDGNRVLYFMDSNPTGSYIISVRISAEDGTLSSTTRTSTGGNGLAGLLAVSQDSIVVSGQVRTYPN
jgi:hypothetical protein